MNYKCIVWCNFNKNSGTSGSSNGAKWKMTDTGVIDVEFDGFETNDTHYIAIVRGDVPGNGNECTIITDKTTKGFRILNKKDINTMASYDYGTIAVFYDPTKVTKQEKVFPPKGTILRNATNGELYDVSIQGNEYIWVGLPTSNFQNVYVVNASETSQAMRITQICLNRLQTIESDDYTWYKCSPSMFYDTDVTFNGIRFNFSSLANVLVVFDESTNLPYVGTYDDAWKLDDTDVFRFTQNNTQPLCNNGYFTSVTKDMKFVIGISLATIENNQYPGVALMDLMTNTIIANTPDSEEAEKDFVHWDYNGVRYYEVVPKVELPNGGVIGTVIIRNTDCGVYCWRDNSTNKAYIKGIKQ